MSSNSTSKGEGGRGWSGGVWSVRSYVERVGAEDDDDLEGYGTMCSRKGSVFYVGMLGCPHLDR